MFLADHSDRMIIIKQKHSEILICQENTDCKRNPELNMSITIASTEKLGCDGACAQESLMQSQSNIQWLYLSI